MNESYSNKPIHFFAILVAGSSASLWAVFSKNYLMLLLWLILFLFWIVLRSSNEINKIVKLLIQIGSVLIVVSLFQIIFRRQGAVIFSIYDFPLVYSDGLIEAILVWMRYMLIFMLAFIFSRVPIFDFFLFLNKIKIPMQFAMLLLVALKFLPYIYEEAQKCLWSLRFRGIDPKVLTWKQKYLALRKIFNPLFFRGIHYVSYSSLALELRGYGVTERVKINATYPFRLNDYLILTLVMIVNLFGIIIL